MARDVPDIQAASVQTRVSRFQVSKLNCLILGHRIDGHLAAVPPQTSRHCSCGTVLFEDGSEAHLRHILSCFLFGHLYTKMESRDGHSEYVCVSCGHPLLVNAARSTYALKDSFHKHVRHRCWLFGHSVHRVCKRSGLWEYACGCGHSFLRREQAVKKIRHPLKCVLRGHYVSFIGKRNGYEEFRCRNCGHPFCFAITA